MKNCNSKNTNVIYGIDTISFNLAALIMVPSLNYFLNIILIYGFGFPSISLYMYLLMALLGIFSYFKLNLKNKVITLISFLFFIGLFLCYIMYPNISSLLISSDFNPLNSGILMMVLYCIPSMNYASLLKKWDNLLRYCYIYSLLIIPLAILSYYVVIIKSSLYQDINYMSFSYNLLLSICFCTIFGIRSKRYFNIGLGLLGFLMILFVGARGALLCSVFFYLTAIIKLSSKKTKYVIITFVVLITIIFFYFLSVVSNGVNDFLGSYDTYSRTLQLLVSGGVFESEGRNELIPMLKDGILNNPFGYGLFGDRVILTPLMGLSTSSYAHSIIWEFIIDFGVFLGPILLLLLFLRIIRCLKRFPQELLFVYIPLVAYFLKLFMSSSYLLEIPFWALLGIIINKNNSIPYKYWKQKMQ